MRNRTVMGIFDRPDDAEKAKDELLHAGIARHRIAVRRLANEEGIAAQAELPDPCVVSVVARSPIDKQHIARLMLRLGARETVESRSS